MNIVILIQNLELKGILDISEGADRLVIFAHDNGDGRLSERNRFVAAGWQKLGMATLQLDLLTEEEEKIHENILDIEILTERLIAVTKWCMENEKTKQLRLGYFGSGTGGAAALSAAAYWGTKIKAVVTHGGRSDLAMEVLDLIESPTQLIVGGEDKRVIDFSRQAFQKIGTVKKMEVVPEPGMMDKVVELGGMWFAKYL